MSHGKFLVLGLGVGIFRSGIDRVSILTSWVLGLRIFSSGFESIVGLRIVHFNQVVSSRFPDGIRVELYAPGGASFACCYK